jgi:hypothetical protein
LPFEITDDSPEGRSDEICAQRVNEIIAATTDIGMIRERATEICIGLQDLELPAFVTLTIIDEAVHENSIRMWAKWELVTAVKHYRDRQERALTDAERRRRHDALMRARRHHHGRR